MWEFLRAGGPFMFLLLFSSIVGLTFIIERGLVLRWKKVIPPLLQTSVENCKSLNDLPMLEKAGLGIAFRAKAKLREAADTSISSGGLDSILYLLGIHAEELEEVAW